MQHCSSSSAGIKLCQALGLGAGFPGPPYRRPELAVGRRSGRLEAGKVPKKEAQVEEVPWPFSLAQ